MDKSGLWRSIKTFMLQGKTANALEVIEAEAAAKLAPVQQNIPDDTQDEVIFEVMGHASIVKEASKKSDKIDYRSFSNALDRAMMIRDRDKA